MSTIKRCKIYKKLISGYMDNELTDSEKLIVDGHIKNCTECRTELDGLKGLQSSLDSLSKMPEAVLPDNFPSMVMYKIGGAKPSVYLFGALRRISIKKAASFIGVAAILFLLVYNLSTLTEPFMIRPYAADIAHHDGGLTVNGRTLEKDTLSKSDTIDTRGDGTIRFLISDRIRLVLKPGSRIVISGLSINKQTDKISVNLILNKGSLLVDKSATGEMAELTIETPQAAIRPVGTEFFVGIYGGSTSIYVKDGIVEAAPLLEPDKTVKIGAMKKAMVGALGAVNGPLAMTRDELILFGEVVDIEEKPAKDEKLQPIEKEELKRIYYETE